jgi:hypothetical protein
MKLVHTRTDGPHQRPKASVPDRRGVLGGDSGHRADGEANSAARCAPCEGFAGLCNPARTPHLRSGPRDRGASGLGVDAATVR